MENTDQNQENEPNEEAENPIDWTDILKTFLGTDNFEKLLGTVEKNKALELQAKKDELLHKKDANDTNLTFWTRKFIKEGIVIFLILLTICILSFLCKIENDTIGTLLGSVIGYAIGNFSSSNKN